MNGKVVVERRRLMRWGAEGSITRQTREAEGRGGRGGKKITIIRRKLTRRRWPAPCRVPCIGAAHQAPGWCVIVDQVPPLSHPRISAPNTVDALTAALHILEES